MGHLDAALHLGQLRGGASCDSPTTGHNHARVAISASRVPALRIFVINTAIPSATMSAMSTEMTSRSLLVKITCGAEAAERANQAWTVAAMGVAVGASVSVWLTGEAVWFAVQGRQPDLELPYATPVVELVETVRLGGAITVCTQCAARRELAEDDLVESATIQGAASFVEAALADNTPGPGLLALPYATDPDKCSQGARRSCPQAWHR